MILYTMLVSLAAMLLLTAVIAGKLIAARFLRSRCHSAPLRYVFGWNYKHDGYACIKCGMLQD